MEKNPGSKLTLVTVAYILISLIASLTGMIIIFYIAVMIAAIYFLYKFKNDIRQKDIFISIIMANLAGIYGMVTSNYVMGPLVIAMVMSSYMGVIPIFRKYLYTDKVLGENPKNQLELG